MFIKIDKTEKYLNYSTIAYSMTTTIQVNNDTVLFLKALREQYGAQSYDSLIKILIGKATRPMKSMYGALGKMTKEEILKDLRDKSDRY